MLYRRTICCLVVAAFLGGFNVPLGAKGTHVRSAKGAHVKTTSHTSSKATTRDTHGRIARSAAAKHDFEVQSGYPHGRPGYVVDHIVPLACGGLDAPSNMQWQTIQAAKAKDQTERKGC